MGKVGSNKKWTMNIFAYDAKTKEIKFKERSVTKPMTEIEFKKLLKKRLDSYKDPVCYAEGDWLF